jgi:LysM repeat protein
MEYSVRQKLIILAAIIAILIGGTLAMALSLRQEQGRKQSVAAVPFPEFDALQPTPTLHTASQKGGLAETTTQITHIVASGETLLAIALNYDVPMEKIISANDMENPDDLSVGQELLVPGVIPPTVVPTYNAESPLAPSEAPLAKPPSVSVNGLAESTFVIMPSEVRQNARQIFANGQQLGRSPNAFSVVGDSTTEIPFFLARFDQKPYKLGEYAYLQSVIDYFAGSFSRDSIAVRVGLHSYTLFDPLWADKALCLANEAVLPCEIRLHNPSIIFIRLGSNDVGVTELFDESIREAVQYAIDNGVIPVIGTKADRFEGSNQNNEILRQIAADFQVPLWEYDLVAATMDGRGLDVDAVHMTTFYPHDYTLPEAFQRGHAMHNLTALMVLDTLWKEVILPAHE